MQESGCRWAIFIPMIELCSRGGDFCHVRLAEGFSSSNGFRKLETLLLPLLINTVVDESPDLRSNLSL
jgi:hypothetical protein